MCDRGIILAYVIIVRVEDLEISTDVTFRIQAGRGLLEPLEKLTTTVDKMMASTMETMFRQ